MNVTVLCRMTSYPSYGSNGVLGHRTFSLKTGEVLGKSGGVGHPKAYGSCCMLWWGQGKEEGGGNTSCFILLSIVVCILDSLDESVVFPFNFFRI